MKKFIAYQYAEQYGMFIVVVIIYFDSQTSERAILIGINDLHPKWRWKVENAVLPDFLTSIEVK